MSSTYPSLRTRRAALLIAVDEGIALIEDASAVFEAGQGLLGRGLDAVGGLIP